MKSMNAFATAVLVVALAACQAQAADDESVALTVYNDGNAIVRETRTIFVPAGSEEVRLENVAKTIDPTSVRFRSLTDPEGTAILEQNFEYDLVSADKLLTKYIGSDITVVTADKTSYEGTLMSFEKEQLVLSAGDDGPLSIIARGENVKTIEVGSLPEGLITKPTLMWLVSSRKGGTQQVEVAYSARSISWRADYIAVLAAGEKALDLSGWVTLTNNSGKTYADASLKLVAGEVHRVEEERVMMGGGRGGMRMAEMAYRPQFEEKGFAEYHLYTMERPTTIKDNQIKQIELLRTSDVPTQKKYLYDPLRGMRPSPSRPMTGDLNVGEKGKVQVFLVFKNDKASNLGMPLPGGRVRVFKYDEDDLEFIGEDSIEHTPKDEKVELLVGNAFDITAERKKTDFQRPRGVNRIDESFEITLRNHKEEAVTVLAREHLFRWTSWKITSASAAYEKLDAQTIEFEVNLKPDEERKFTYTVRYEW